jgi:hypothetical protein
MEFVLAFEEALGKVRPAPDDPAPTDLGALLEAPRVALKAGVIRRGWRPRSRCMRRGHPLQSDEKATSQELTTGSGLA